MKRLLAILCAAILALALAPVAAAATQYGDCSPSRWNADTNGKAIMWENSKSDTSDGNDQLRQCSSAVPNYETWLHGLPGTCHNGGVFGGSSTWNDCISSVTLWVPAGKVACFFADSGYPRDAADRPRTIAVFVGPLNGSRFNILSDYTSSYRQVSGNAGNDC